MAGTTWPLEEEETVLDRLVEKALEEGPQVITTKGREAVVVVAAEEYRRLCARAPSFVDYLREGPKLDDETIRVINDRSSDTGREIDI